MGYTGPLADRDRIFTNVYGFQEPWLKAARAHGKPPIGTRPRAHSISTHRPPNHSGQARSRNTGAASAATSSPTVSGSNMVSASTLTMTS